MRRFPGYSAHRGESISEYAIVLALVVLVGIPAFLFLGRSVNNGIAQNGDLSQADALFGLIGASGPGGGMTLSGGSGGMSQLRVTGNSETAEGPASVNANGPFGSNQHLSLSIGSVTTSAEGASQISDLLAEVAKTGQAPGGLDLAKMYGKDWKKVQKRLKDLSKEGHELAEKEARSLANNGYRKLTNQAEDLKKVGKQARKFNETYMDLVNDLGQMNPSSPDHAAFAQFVDQMSGAVSHSAEHFYSEKTRELLGKAYQTPWLDSPSIKKKIAEGHIGQPVGQSFNPNDTVDVPVVTQKASTQIGNAANNIGTAGGASSGSPAAGGPVAAP